MRFPCPSCPMDDNYECRVLPSVFEVSKKNVKIYSLARIEEVTLAWVWKVMVFDLGSWEVDFNKMYGRFLQVERNSSMWLIVASIEVTMAKHFKLINFNVLSWVELSKDFPFIDVNGVRRGNHRSEWIFGACRLRGFRFLMNMPWCICPFFLFPMCNYFFISGTNVFRECAERKI